MNVLFVDDDAMNRRVVKDMLQVVGAQMDEADSAEAGLSKIGASDYQVILMDLRMPGMDGLAATRKIRSRTDDKARLPIVVVTADTSSDLEERCMAAGADCIIKKPVAMGSLIDTIGRLLARSAHSGVVLT